MAAIAITWHVATLLLLFTGQITNNVADPKSLYDLAEELGSG